MKRQVFLVGFAACIVVGTVFTLTICGVHEWQNHNRALAYADWFFALALNLLAFYLVGNYQRTQ